MIVFLNDVKSIKHQVLLIKDFDRQKMDMNVNMKQMYSDKFDNKNSITTWQQFNSKVICYLYSWNSSIITQDFDNSIVCKWFDSAIK